MIVSSTSESPRFFESSKKPVTSMYSRLGVSSTMPQVCATFTPFIASTRSA